MATSEIKMKMSLATAGIKNGLTKAKASVNDFAVTTKSKFASIKKSFAGLGGILTGAVVGGFTVAAKSALNYAKEVSNLSSIAGINVEQFQKLAFGAKSVGVENNKLADIFKDVNDKLNDFLQAGSGPMKDFFEYIGPAVGVTAEHFKNLSGPQALQLYYDSLEKANLNHEEMTFYMEAIANDATVLIPLLKDGGKSWKKYADEAERAGLVLSTELTEELKEAQFELDKLSAQGTVGMGKLVASLKEAKWYEIMVPPILAAKEAWKGFADYAGLRAKELSKTETKAYEETVAAVKKLQDERKDNAVKGIEIVTEAQKKANIEAAKLAVALGKTQDKIYAEREKRAKKDLNNEQLLLKATQDREAAMVAFLNPLQTAQEKTESLLKLEEAMTKEVEAKLKVSAEQEKITESIAKHVEDRRKAEAKSFENAEVAIAKRKKLEAELGDLMEGSTAHLKKQEQIVIAINEEGEARKVNEQAVFDTLDAIAMKLKDRADAQKKAAEDQAEADAAAIDAGIKQLELELELAKAEGDPRRIAAAEEALDLETQIVSLIDQHKLSREEAAAIVTKQNAALKDQKDLQLELLKAEADGNILLADELQKRVEKQEEAVAIMEEFKISMAEALSIAEKLAALRAGPDLNQSGFTTGFEQREFERQQKKQQKLLRAAQKQEERDQREQGGNIPNVSRQKRQTDFGPVNRLIAKDKSERIAENKAIGRLVRQGMKRPAAEAQFAQARAARQAAIDAKRAQQMPFGIQDPRGTTQLTQEQIDAITIAPAEIARRRQVRADAAEQKVRDQQAKNEQQADAILAKSDAAIAAYQETFEAMDEAQETARALGDKAEFKRLRAEELDNIRSLHASRKKAEQEAADLRASGPLGTTKLTPEQIAAITTGGGAKPQPGGKGQPGQPGGGGNVKPGQPGGGGNGKPGQPGKPPAQVKKPAKPVDPAVDELMKNGAKLDKQTAVLEQIKAALDC